MSQADGWWLLNGCHWFPSGALRAPCHDPILKYHCNEAEMGFSCDAEQTPLQGCLATSFPSSRSAPSGNRSLHFGGLIEVKGVFVLPWTSCSHITFVEMRTCRLWIADGSPNFPKKHENILACSTCLSS